MVVGAFPLAKLGLLAVRQLSKPVVNVIKNRAKKHPFFRSYICIPPARLYNNMEMQMKFFTNSKVIVPKLSDQAAVDLGAELLGEFLIFAILSATMVYEYVKSSSNTKAKNKYTDEVLDALLESGISVGEQTEVLTSAVRQLQMSVRRIIARTQSQLVSQIGQIAHTRSHFTPQIEVLDPWQTPFNFGQLLQLTFTDPDDSIDPPIPMGKCLDPYTPTSTPGLFHMCDEHVVTAPRQYYQKKITIKRKKYD